MAYPIDKLAKATTSWSTSSATARLDELEMVRYNDAVLRHLTVKMKKAETTASPMMKIVEREEARKAASDQSAQAAATATSANAAAAAAAPTAEATA